MNKRRRSVKKQHKREFAPSDSLKKFIPPVSDLGGMPSPQWDIARAQPAKPRPVSSKKPTGNEQAALSLY